MEKLFQARWWDYSTLPLNLNGRVALPISLFWGFGVVVIVKLVHPFVSHIILGLPSVTAIATSVVLTDLLMFDLGFTVANVIGFGAATQRIGNTVETLKAELKNQVTTDTKLSRPLAWFENFRTNIKLIDQQPKLNYVQRRLLRAFPNIKFKRTTTSPTDITRIVDFLRKKRRWDDFKTELWHKSFMPNSFFVFLNNIAKTCDTRMVTVARFLFAKISFETPKLFAFKCLLL